MPRNPSQVRDGANTAAPRRWGDTLVERASKRLEPYFPASPGETVTNYLFAHARTCPRTGRLVPLVPDWWLRKGNKPAAVRMISEAGGVKLTTPRFEVLHGPDIDFDADKGIFAGGRATSPYDDLVIDGDYIKCEAQAGRMTQMLYAVVTKTPTGRSFRAPDRSRSGSASGGRRTRWRPVSPVGLPITSFPPRKSLPYRTTTAVTGCMGSTSGWTSSGRASSSPMRHSLRSSADLFPRSVRRSIAF